MLNHSTPDDFVIATGIKHSLQQFVEIAFRHVDMNFRDFVKIDSALSRPTDVHTLCGDASKARRELAWEPQVAFPELVRMMVDADLARVKRECSGD